jgi:hypothetical protein
MKKMTFTFALTALFLFCFVVSASAAGLVDITYTATSNGGNNWTFDYMVQNNGISGGVSIFDIYFPLIADPNIPPQTPEYSNVSIVGNPAGWDFIAFPYSGPNLYPYADGEIQALGTPIAMGSSLDGFVVKFDYSGQAPDSQFFQIWDDSGNELANGYTHAPISTSVPEPSLLVLLGLGIAGVAGSCFKLRS